MKRFLASCALSIIATSVAVVADERKLVPPAVATISGRVTSATTGQPVERFCVFLFTDPGEINGLPVGIGIGPWDGSIYWDSYAETDAYGDYKMTPVWPGTHRVLFRECGVFGEDQHRYQAQWWNSQAGPGSAKPVLAVGDVTGIDAHVTPYPN